jgi:hypothetical protein
MAGIASAPLISVPLKKTDDTDFTEPMERYIAIAYGDDPSKYRESIMVFNKLRQDTRGAGKHATARDILYRYYAQLELSELRFPIEETKVKISFTW